MNQSKEKRLDVDLVQNLDTPSDNLLLNDSPYIESSNMIDGQRRKSDYVKNNDVQILITDNNNMSGDDNLLMSDVKSGGLSKDAAL